MKRTLLAALLALCLATPSLASANDAGFDVAFGGAGALPIPIKNEAIEMVEEHVVIERTAERTWTITCDFSFHNTSDKEQTVRMGFPFPPIEESEVTVPPGREVNEALVYDFVAQVRGKVVKVDIEDIAPSDELYYTKGYLWDVKFAADEAVAVRNVYITGESASADMTNWVPYVLKTGALWKGGKIGRSRLEVKPNLPFKFCHEIYDYCGKPTPAGYTVTGKDSAKLISWDLTDFAPTEDLDACMFYADSFAYKLLSEGDMNLDSLGKDELKVLRNTVYARYGYIFKTKDMKSHFAAQWWYEPNPDYNKSMLSDYDWELIKRLKEREESLK